jgi:hypothetical protein
MSIAFDRCCLTFRFIIPTAVELSQATGVGGWGHPISAKVVRSGTASLQFMKRAPLSASEAADMTARMILEIVKMGPLKKAGVSARLPK